MDMHTYHKDLEHFYLFADLEVYRLFFLNKQVF